MDFRQLSETIARRSSVLCVGLDPDPERMPKGLSTHDLPLFEFCRLIVDATAPFAVAYKINTAFFEAAGPEGWESLERLQAYIGKDFFRIADAKRGDIGNTGRLYAQAFFERMDFDAITVSPYMGLDTLEPFLAYEGKCVYILCLTSNSGAGYLQLTRTEESRFLFEQVAESVAVHAQSSRLGLVAGATQAEHLPLLLKAASNSHFLVPGVGTQGASLEQTLSHFTNHKNRVLINSSRDILYASQGPDFAERAAEKAQALQSVMASWLKG